MKMCEQILKKETAPQYNPNSLNCKNHDVPNNSRDRFAAISQTKCQNQLWDEPDCSSLRIKKE